MNKTFKTYEGTICNTHVWFDKRRKISRIIYPAIKGSKRMMFIRGWNAEVGSNLVIRNGRYVSKHTIVERFNARFIPRCYIVIAQRLSMSGKATLNMHTDDLIVGRKTKKIIRMCGFKKYDDFLEYMKFIGADDGYNVQLIRWV